jgi:hypothetical protein
METVSDGRMMEQPLLAYIVSSLQAGTVENVKKAVLGFFTAKQIGDAKHVLWENASIDIIGRKVARKNTNIRSEENANVDDIISAVQKLDKDDSVPLFVVSAYNLANLPRSMPEELNNISLVDRLATLEGKVRRMEETIVRNACDIHELETNQASHSVEDEPEKDKEDHTDTLNSASHYLGRGRGRAKPNLQEQAPIVPGAYSFADAAKNNIGTNLKSVSMRGRGPNRGIMRQNVPHPDVQRLRGSTQSLCSDGSSYCGSDGFALGRHEVLKNNRQERRRRNAIVGKAKTHEKIKGAPEPSRDVFVFRLDEGTKESEVEDFVRESGITIRAVKCVSHPDAKYCSFRVTVGKTDFPKLMSDTLWPAGVMIRKYIPARNEAGLKDKY